MKRTLGAILTGGRGRRFGTAKDLARLPDGTPFLRRAQQALRPVCDQVVTVGGDAHAEIPWIADAAEDAGPLAGLSAALSLAHDRGLPGATVLAVDLPRISAPAVLHLLRRWRESARPAASVVVATGAGGPQPLAGVWGTEAAARIGASLDRGERRVRDVLDLLPDEGIELITVGEDELTAAAGHSDVLLNVNRPEDLIPAAEPVCPPLVAVQGWKNAGKTTVAEQLVGALVDRGVRVMTLKRGHGFDLDRPGTDSYRLSAAGSERSVLVGPDTLAVMGSREAGISDSLTELARRHLADADLVVAEGWKQAGVPAIEVRRVGARSEDPLEAGDRILARVGDAVREGEAPEGTPRHTPADGDVGAWLADRVIERILVPQSVAQ